MAERASTTEQPRNRESAPSRESTEIPATLQKVNQLISQMRERNTQIERLARNRVFSKTESFYSRQVSQLAEKARSHQTTLNRLMQSAPESATELREANETLAHAISELTETIESAKSSAPKVEAAPVQPYRLFPKKDDKEQRLEKSKQLQEQVPEMPSKELATKSLKTLLRFTLGSKTAENIATDALTLAFYPTFYLSFGVTVPVYEWARKDVLEKVAKKLQEATKHEKKILPKDFEKELKQDWESQKARMKEIIENLDKIDHAKSEYLDSHLLLLEARTCSPETAEKLRKNLEAKMQVFQKKYGQNHFLSPEAAAEQATELHQKKRELEKQLDDAIRARTLKDKALDMLSVLPSYSPDRPTRKAELENKLKKVTAEIEETEALQDILHYEAAVNQADAVEKEESALLKQFKELRRRALQAERAKRRDKSKALRVMHYYKTKIEQALEEPTPEPSTRRRLEEVTRQEPLGPSEFCLRPDEFTQFLQNPEELGGRIREEMEYYQHMINEAGIPPDHPGLRNLRDKILLLAVDFGKDSLHEEAKKRIYDQINRAVARYQFEIRALAEEMPPRENRPSQAYFERYTLRLKEFSDYKENAELFREDVNQAADQILRHFRVNPEAIPYEFEKLTELIYEFEKQPKKRMETYEEVQKLLAGTIEHYQSENYAMQKEIERHQCQFFNSSELREISEMDDSVMLERKADDTLRDILKDAQGNPDPSALKHETYGKYASVQKQASEAGEATGLERVRKIESLDQNLKELQKEVIADKAESMQRMADAETDRLAQEIYHESAYDVDFGKETIKQIDALHAEIEALKQASREQRRRLAEEFDERIAAIEEIMRREHIDRVTEQTKDYIESITPDPELISASSILQLNRIVADISKTPSAWDAETKSKYFSCVYEFYASAVKATPPSEQNKLYQGLASIAESLGMDAPEKVEGSLAEYITQKYGSPPQLDAGKDYASLRADIDQIKIYLKESNKIESHPSFAEMDDALELFRRLSEAEEFTFGLGPIFAQHEKPLKKGSAEYTKALKEQIDAINEEIKYVIDHPSSVSGREKPGGSFMEDLSEAPSSFLDESEELPPTFLDELPDTYDMVQQAEQTETFAEGWKADSYLFKKRWIDSIEKGEIEIVGLKELPKEFKEGVEKLASSLETRRKIAIDKMNKAKSKDQWYKAFKEYKDYRDSKIPSQVVELANRIKAETDQKQELVAEAEKVAYDQQVEDVVYEIAQLQSPADRQKTYKQLMKQIKRLKPELSFARENKSDSVAFIQDLQTIYEEVLGSKFLFTSSDPDVVTAIKRLLDMLNLTEQDL